MIILLNNIRECFLKISKRSEFGKISIVVFVAYDVDAICALRILSVCLQLIKRNFSKMKTSSTRCSQWEAFKKWMKQSTSLVKQIRPNLSYSSIVPAYTECLIFGSQKRTLRLRHSYLITINQLRKEMLIQKIR